MEVTDQRVGPESCAGGSCDPQCTHAIEPTEGSRITSLTCEGIPCTATVASIGSHGRWKIDVVSETAGTADVRVSLRDARGDVATVETSIAFVRPSGISIERPARESAFEPSRAVLLGASFTWCASIVVDADLPRDAVMDVKTKGPITRTPRGDGCDLFGTTGIGDVEIAYAELGAKRTESLRVVGPSDVTALELVDVGAPEDRLIPLESSPTTDAPLLTTLDACKAARWGEANTPGYLVALRARTADGGALAPATLLASEPGRAAVLQRGSFAQRHLPVYPGTLVALLTLGAGAGPTGRVTASIGGATLDVPIIGPDGCGSDPPDADAGASDDASSP